MQQLGLGMPIGLVFRVTELKVRHLRVVSHFDGNFSFVIGKNRVVLLKIVCEDCTWPKGHSCFQSCLFNVIVLLGYLFLAAWLQDVAYERIQVLVIHLFNALFWFIYNCIWLYSLESSRVMLLKLIVYRLGYRLSLLKILLNFKVSVPYLYRFICSHFVFNNRWDGRQILVHDSRSFIIWIIVVLFFMNGCLMQVPWD